MASKGCIRSRGPVQTRHR